MRMDGYTDMMKIIVAFRNFANVPKSKVFLALSMTTGRDSSGVALRLRNR